MLSNSTTTILAGFETSLSGVDLGAVENQLAAVFGQCRDRRSLVGSTVVHASDLLNLVDDVLWNVLW